VLDVVYCLVEQLGEWLSYREHTALRPGEVADDQPERAQQAQLGESSPSRNR
jgi:hypothetical protein